MDRSNTVGDSSPARRSLLIRVLNTSLKVVGVLFMALVLGVAGYLLFEQRRSASLEARSAPLRTWPEDELPLRDGPLVAVVATRCKESSLDYRLTLSPVKVPPTQLPTWLDSQLIPLGNGSTALPRTLTVLRVGPVTFGASQSREDVIARGLMMAGRASVSKFSVHLRDVDEFDLYTWDVATMTQSMDSSNTIGGYEAIGSTFCAAERYLRGTSVTIEWFESGDR